MLKGWTVRAKHFARTPCWTTKTCKPFLQSPQLRIYGANQSRLTLWNFQSESATGLKTSNMIHHLRGRLKTTESNTRGAVVTALQMLSWHSILVLIVENLMMKPKNVLLFAISRVEICLKVTVQSSSTILVPTAAQQNTQPTCAMSCKPTAELANIVGTAQLTRKAGWCPSGVEANVISLKKSSMTTRPGSISCPQEESTQKRIKAKRCTSGG